MLLGQHEGDCVEAAGQERQAFFSALQAGDAMSMVTALLDHIGSVSRDSASHGVLWGVRSPDTRGLLEAHIVDAWEQHRRGDTEEARARLASLLSSEALDPPDFAYPEVLALVADVDTGLLRRMVDRLARDPHRAQVARMLADRGYEDECLHIARTLTGALHRTTAMGSLKAPASWRQVAALAGEWLEGLGFPNRGFLGIFVARNLARHGILASCAELVDSLDPCDAEHAADILREAAESAAAAGDHQGARQFLQRAREKARTTPDVRARFAATTIRLGLRAEGLAELEHAEQDSQDDPRALLAVAQALDQAGLHERADIAWERLTGMMAEAGPSAPPGADALLPPVPASWDRVVPLCVGLCSVQRYEQAEHVAREALRGDPSRHGHLTDSFLLDVAEARVCQGDVEGAQRVLRLVPDGPLDNPERVALALLSSGRHHDAFALASSLPPESLVEFAVEALRQRLDDFAGPVFADVIARARRSLQTTEAARALAWTAIACSRAGDHDGARECLQHLTLFPDPLAVLYDLAPETDLPGFSREHGMRCRALLESPQADANVAHQVLHHLAQVSPDDLLRLLPLLGSPTHQLEYLGSRDLLLLSGVRGMDVCLGALLAEVRDPDCRFRGLQALALCQARAGLHEEVAVTLQQAGGLLPSVAPAFESAPLKLKSTAAMCDALACARGDRSRNAEVPERDLVEARAVTGHGPAALEQILRLQDTNERCSMLDVLLSRLSELGVLEEDPETLASAVQAIMAAPPSQEPGATGLLLTWLPQALVAGVLTGRATEQAVEKVLAAFPNGGPCTPLFFLGSVVAGLTAAGRGSDAVDLALSCLPRWRRLLPQVALVLADMGDRESFSRLMPTCWEHAESTWGVLGAIARLCPRPVEAGRAIWQWWQGHARLTMGALPRYDER